MEFHILVMLCKSNVYMNYYNENENSKYLFKKDIFKKLEYLFKNLNVFLNQSLHYQK